MALYLIKRVLNAIPILIGITIISFIIIHMAPGGPLSQFSEDPTIKAIDIQNMTKVYGLDKPLYRQYLDWVGGMLKGDFGTSFQKSEPVSSLIVDRIPTTLMLTASSFLLSILIAVPLGILCAVKANSKLDQIISGFTFAGIAVPGFWLALLLMMFFSVKLGWLPSGGLKTINEDFSLVDRIKHLILPVTAMTLGEVAIWIRHIRSSMLEVITQDYMRTAHAKGLPGFLVLFQHGLRNALIPVATLFGLTLAGFFTGSLILENIFSIPGMGRLFIESAFQRDYPVLFAVTTMASILTVVGSIVADILIAILDPRINLGRSQEARA